MALPAGVVVGTVVGEFLDDDGTPMTGEVRFTPRVNPLPYPDTDPPVIVVNDGAVGVLDADGQLSVQLIAADYRVEPRVGGKPLATYLVQIEAGTQDLAELAPIADPGGGPVEQGPPGKSAYQLAVEGGFVGTQAQWLASLVGAKGDQGDASTVPGPAGVANIEIVAVLPPLEEQEDGVFYVVQE